MGILGKKQRSRYISSRYTLELELNNFLTKYTCLTYLRWYRTKILFFWKIFSLWWLKQVTEWCINKYSRSLCLSCFRMTSCAKFFDTSAPPYRSYHDVRSFNFPSSWLRLKTGGHLREPSGRGSTLRKVFSIGVLEFGLCRNAVTAISPGTVTYSVGLNNILNRAT